MLHTAYAKMGELCCYLHERYYTWLALRVANLVHCCAAALAEPLLIIFHESYNPGTFPPDWKTANIVPIFNKGDKADPGNYQCLTSVLRK